MTVRELPLGGLIVGGRLLDPRLGDDPRTGKADGRPRLRQVDVAERGVGRQNAGHSRIGHHDDIGQTGFGQAGAGGGGLRHLHQGQQAFLHPRAAGCREEHQGPAPLGTFFPRHLSHGAANEMEIGDAEDDRAPRMDAVPPGQLSFAPVGTTDSSFAS